MMDEIRIRRLEIFAHHGVYAEETQNGQFFYVNATLYTNTVAAGKSDDLTLSTNYGDVCLFIDRWMKENTYKLLEAAAEHLAEALLLRFPLIRELDLEIEAQRADSSAVCVCLGEDSSRLAQGLSGGRLEYGRQKGLH